LNFTSVPILASLEHLHQTDSTLMVDDFHYIDPAVQKSIVQSLKAEVFKGLQVVLLAVPHRAFDLVMAQTELEGRFKHISIPNWALNDLLLIPEKGFTALNVSAEKAIHRRICEDSFGNPLLVQEICSEFCLRNRIEAVQSATKELEGKLLESTYRAVAETKGFPIYPKLVRGPAGSRTRRTRTARGGGELDLYPAVLGSVARLGPKTTTSLEDIRGSLREVFADGTQMPDRREVVDCLNQMSKIAKKVQGEPPLEWITNDQKLEIIDPFLLFCLKWSH